MKVLWHMLGMLAFGLIALALPAWLGQVRMGKPVEIPQAVVSREVESTGPLDSLSIPERVWSGLQMSVITAERNLKGGNRAKAMHTLDAARRVAAVGVHALPSRKSRYERVRRTLDQARREIQNGRPDEAVQTLSSMIAGWDNPAAGRAEMDGVKLATGAHYTEAVVLNVYGARIGKVVQAGDQRMTVALGGVQDVFGFLNLFPGTRVEVPVSQVLAGSADRTKGANVLLVTWGSKR